MKKLTAARAREVFLFDPAAGTFTRLVRTGTRAKLGPVDRRPDPNGYFHLAIDGEDHLAHRVAWLYYYGRWPKHGIDHRDRDPSNNRIDNLREATQAMNTQNVGKAKRDNKTGVRGVELTPLGHFHARIRVDGVRYDLGTFTDIEIARAAYLNAKAVLHPAWEPPQEGA